MKEISLLNVKENQQYLRDELVKFITVNPCSMDKAADAIGIHINTINSFLFKNRNASTEALLKINKFLQEKGGPQV